MATATLPRAIDPLRSAIRLAAIFAAIKLALHLGTNLLEPHLGYSYFRDEFYYLICGRNLAWGYVDHGPIVALQARIAETLFGHSLAGIRLLSTLAGASRVFLTGMLAWSLGGRRPAQGLAMLCVLVAPQYLGIDSYLSMNSCESMFWIPCLLALILLDRQIVTSRNAWLLLGVSAGLGLLNKPSMVFFLVSLGLALLLTPQRRLLLTRHAAMGIGLLILIALPNLLWQIHNHWPTLEFLHNGKVENKNVILGPLDFFLTQLKDMHPVSILIWVPGVIYLLRRTAVRWLGFTFVIFFALMFALHAKDYYLAPIYPLVFAAGGVAWEGRFAARHLVQQNSALAFPVAYLTLIVTGLLLLPMAIPVFTPSTWVHYAKTLHLYDKTSATEHEESGTLPQFYADRFGWQEETSELLRIFHSLSPEDQHKVVITASNYGEAGAPLFLTRPGDLPPVVSGHNNFWIWGPHSASGEVAIVISGGKVADLEKFYESCVVAGRMDNPLSMTYERRNIYLCRNRRKNLTDDWLQFKHYI